MKKKEIIIIAAAVVLLAILLTVADAMQPKNIDWRPTYANRDKIPFGLYVLDKEAPTLFKQDSINTFWETPYEFFDAKYSYENKKYTVKGSFLKIEDDTTIDKESVKELMHFADYGNTVMLSMKNFPQLLLDTLHVTMDYQKIFIDSVQVSLQTNPKDKYWIKSGMGAGYFDSIPKNDSVKVLGYQEYKEEKKPNFIEARYGHGRFLLHTQPAAFSNFYLLKGNHYNYAQNALSALPQGTLYWQDQYGREVLGEGTLRYIMSQPGLKWAWRLGLWGLLFFIIFNARRRQRIVPEIAPVRNTTVDFAKTIGNLYYQEKDHHTIIEKKIIYFLEQIRTEYLIDTSTLDDAFVEKMHLKTGKPVEDIQQTVHIIKQYRHSFSSTDADVVAINNAIEKLRL